MACLTLLSNSKEAGDPGVRRKGVAEEVGEVTELANGSIPSRCVHLRVYLPVHCQGPRVPGALCPLLCVARCAPFGLGTWKSLTALVYLSTSQVSGSGCHVTALLCLPRPSSPRLCAARAHSPWCVSWCFWDRTGPWGRSCKHNSI